MAIKQGRLNALMEGVKVAIDTQGRSALDASRLAWLEDALERGDLKLAIEALKRSSLFDASSALWERAVSLAVKGYPSGGEHNDRDSAELIELLLSRGAPIDERDSSGLTPLTQAVITSRFAIASLLLDRGADPKAKNARGACPLAMALALGEEKAMRLLLERGGDAKGALAFALQYNYDRSSPRHVGLIRAALERDEIKGAIGLGGGVKARPKGI